MPITEEIVPSESRPTFPNSNGERLFMSDLTLEVWEVDIVQQASTHPQAFGVPFGERRQHQIVRLQTAMTHQVQYSTIANRKLSVIIVPDDSVLGLATVQRLQEWLDGTPEMPGFVQSQLLSLQGAQVVWHPQCVIVMAPANRLTKVCQAVLEGHFYEAELRSLEMNLESNWDQTQGDAPLGFEFNAAAIPRREELSQRFQHVLSMRTRYARLTSHIIVPHVYPPTLASQIGERLRERLRMEERLDLVDGKLEVQEHVYELCSQRTSEFMVARAGHHLEWVIILLLAFQTVLWFVDLLSQTSP